MKLSGIPRLLGIAVLLAAVQPACPQEAGPDAAARIKGILETANKYFRERAYDKARSECAKVLSLPGVTTLQLVHARKCMGDTWGRQRAYENQSRRWRGHHFPSGRDSDTVGNVIHVCWERIN